MANKSPADFILGKGLYGPRLGNAPFDAAETLRNSGRQLLTSPDPQATYSWTVPGTSIRYQVPNYHSPVNQNTSSSHYSSYESGDTASSSIEADAQLKGSYMGFSGSASASVALKNAFQQDAYVALFAFSYDRYSMSLTDNLTFPQQLDPAFLKELGTLPQPFDGQNVDVYAAYHEFLYRWGTHIVTSVTFGQRYFFNISLSNYSGVDFTDFQAAVETQYDGFNASLQAKAGFKSTQAWSTYQQAALRSTIVAGGDATYHAKLAADPTDKQAFETWAGSDAAAAQDKPMQLTLRSLDEVLRLIPSTVASSYAQDMQLAISYLGNVREIVSGGFAPLCNRIGLFVKVKSGGAIGTVSLTLSDDGHAKITAVKDQREGWGWGPTSNEGFEYGQYGRSVRFADSEYTAPPTGSVDAGHLTRFNLTFGPTTTVTLIANDNIEYVVFGSGFGRSNGQQAPYNYVFSNHVYWNPSTDGDQLTLKDIDLGNGAAYRSQSWPGPRGQFQIWQSVVGSSG